ncbi:meiosis-specific kinetochore protein isoform X2 [Macrotis lagotis]|uniref:meiosis-specific kinetochore protein isoform X2 n=1 Tax=Macrotis lagotis TaxID=92651 RepID=UPI003D68C89F
MWPRRPLGQPRPRRVGRLHDTPPPPGPSRGLPEAPLRDEPVGGPKGKLQMKILPKLKENVETTQLHESPTKKHSMQLNVPHQEEQQKSPINEDSKNTNSLVLKESMTNDDLQGENSPLNTQICSDITSSDDISLSLLRSSDTDVCIETTSFEDNLSSFPSPELFREGEFLGCINFKNSTLLDTSRAMAIENMEQFSNLSTILDNSICKIMPEIKKTPDTKTKQANFSVPVGKKNRGFLTSSPASETGRFEINLSPVQKLSLGGELNPNISNYVYSDEIVPASSSEEEKKDSLKAQCIASEVCCIIKSPPRNKCKKMLYWHPIRVSKEVINEPVDKERIKPMERMNPFERIYTCSKEKQTNSSVTIGEKTKGLFGSFPSTETSKLKVTLLASEICCIVKASPPIRHTKKSCCPDKALCKDKIRQVEVVIRRGLVHHNKLHPSPLNPNLHLPQWSSPILPTARTLTAEPQVNQDKKQLEKLKTKETSNHWEEEAPPCITSEICCIVKESPKIKCMNKPCCPPPKVSKDIMIEDYDG